jgi:hypothetical protein
MVSALKEGATSSLMTNPEVKSEGVYVMDVEGGAPATASTSSPSLPLFRYGQATQAALASLGAPLVFEPLRAFELHIYEEYGGFCRDHMQRIQDFQREKDDTPRTMYTRLVRFARESRGVFTENMLVKVFLSKIDKRLLNLALSKIIMEFGGRSTLAEAFAIVEQCDCVLCQHDATDLVTLLVDFSES